MGDAKNGYKETISSMNLRFHGIIGNRDLFTILIHKFTMWNHDNIFDQGMFFGSMNRFRLSL
jgi:hypothetical protein